MCAGSGTFQPGKLKQLMRVEKALKYFISSECRRLAKNMIVPNPSGIRHQQGCKYFQVKTLALNVKPEEDFDQRA